MLTQNVQLLLNLNLNPTLFNAKIGAANFTIK